MSPKVVSLVFIMLALITTMAVADEQFTPSINDEEHSTQTSAIDVKTDVHLSLQRMHNDLTSLFFLPSAQSIIADTYHDTASSSSLTAVRPRLYEERGHTSRSSSFLLPYLCDTLLNPLEELRNHTTSSTSRTLRIEPPLTRGKQPHIHTAQPLVLALNHGLDISLSYGYIIGKTNESVIFPLTLKNEGSTSIIIVNLSVNYSWIQWLNSSFVLDGNQTINTSFQMTIPESLSPGVYPVNLFIATSENITVVKEFEVVLLADPTMDIYGPSILLTSLAPSFPEVSDVVNIEATIEDISGVNSETVMVTYSLDDLSHRTAPMMSLGPHRYIASIGPFDPGYKAVSASITAMDMFDNTNTLAFSIPLNTTRQQVYGNILSPDIDGVYGDDDCWMIHPLGMEDYRDTGDALLFEGLQNISISFGWNDTSYCSFLRLNESLFDAQSCIQFSWFFDSDHDVLLTDESEDAVQIQIEDSALSVSDFVYDATWVSDVQAGGNNDVVACLSSMDLGNDSDLLVEWSKPFGADDLTVDMLNRTSFALWITIATEDEQRHLLWPPSAVSDIDELTSFLGNNFIQAPQQWSDLLFTNKLNLTIHEPQSYDMIPQYKTLIVNVSLETLNSQPLRCSEISVMGSLHDGRGDAVSFGFSPEGHYYTGSLLLDGVTPGLWTLTVEAIVDSMNYGRASQPIIISEPLILRASTSSEGYTLDEIVHIQASVLRPPFEYLTDKEVNVTLHITDRENHTLLGPMLLPSTSIDDSEVFLHDFDASVLGTGSYDAFIIAETPYYSETMSLIFDVIDPYQITVTTDKPLYQRNENVSITGMITATEIPLNTSVTLKITTQGYTRTYTTPVHLGSYAFVFNPFSYEAGSYTLHAETSIYGVHRSVTTTFTIGGLLMRPAKVLMDLNTTASQDMLLTLENIGESNLTGIMITQVDEDPADQIICHINSSQMQTTLSPQEHTVLTATIITNHSSMKDTQFTITASTDQGWMETCDIMVTVHAAIPYCNLTPMRVETGLHSNSSIIHPILLENLGYGTLHNATILQPSLPWMFSTTTALGDIAPQENITFDLYISTYTVPLGIYTDHLMVISDNHAPMEVPIVVHVTTRDNGSLLFHLKDQYQQNISNGQVYLIHQDTYQEYGMMSNEEGDALFEELPLGWYTYEVSHEENSYYPQSGSVLVEPMATSKELDIILYTNFVTYDWSVIPTAIQDYYLIQLSLTFETDIPIPILEARPSLLHFGNVQPGDTMQGSITLINHGLVSLYDVRLTHVLTAAITLELLVDSLEEIPPKSSVEIPYILRVPEEISDCLPFTGGISVVGHYIHYIGQMETIGQAGTYIPLMGSTPCSVSVTECPPIKVTPRVIWFTSIGDTTNFYPTYVNVTNPNHYAIHLTPAVEIMIKVWGLDMGDFVEDLIGASLGLSLIDGIESFGFGTFSSETIGYNETAVLDISALHDIPTGIGLSFPSFKIQAGVVLFGYHKEQGMLCPSIVGKAGFELSWPDFNFTGNPSRLNITIPPFDVITWTYPPFGPHIPSGSGYIGPIPFIFPPAPRVPIVLPPRIPLPLTTNTIHEIVKLSISQNLTLERDAFYAALSMSNKLPDDQIEQLSVSVHFTDDTDLADDLFFVKQPRLQGISDVSGSGVLQPLDTCHMQWLIIPKPGAGGSDSSGRLYQVTADISYTLNGHRYHFTTQEVEITVKPQPRLFLEYYVPSEVIANIPFKLAVKVTNQGNGTAQDLHIRTAQPVLENPSGLLIAFKILDAQMDGRPTSTSFILDFGDLAPGESRFAWWEMVTTLDGSFTEFTGSFSHSNALGGMDTSLVDAVHTHIILKEIDTGDVSYDFLVDSDDDEIPDSVIDSLYGTSVDVEEVSYTIIRPPSVSIPIMTIETPKITGKWIYTSVEDPYANLVPILSIIREDGKTIPPWNYWMRNGRILLVDDPETTYNISFNSSDLTHPIIYNVDPANGSIDVPRPPHLMFSVADLNGDIMNCTLFWKHHEGHWEEVRNWSNLSHGNLHYQTPMTSPWLWGNTMYTWSVNVTDGISWKNRTSTFTTDGSRYDVNNDNKVNFIDAGIVWVHRTTNAVYDGLYDVNQDGKVNFIDAGKTWVNRD